MKRLLSSLVAALALILVAGTARAEPLKVTANVLKACKVTATTDISITWDPTLAGSASGNGGFTVNCTKDVNLNIMANGGANGGSLTTRYVALGGVKIPYALNLGATTLDASAASPYFVATSTGKATDIAVILTATLDTSVDVAAGSYTDDVVVTFSAL